MGEHEYFETDPDLSPETNETILRVRAELNWARQVALCKVKVTPDMPERMMLEVLMARLSDSRETSEDLVRKIRDAGGPDVNRLTKYLYDVVDLHMSRRIDPRVRDALLLIDQGIEPGTMPRASGFHPGTFTPYLRKRAFEEAEMQAAEEAGQEVADKLACELAEEAAEMAAFNLAEEAAALRAHEHEDAPRPVEHGRYNPRPWLHITPPE
jgi:hypothetical protein